MTGSTMLCCARLFSGPALACAAQGVGAMLRSLFAACLLLTALAVEAATPEVEVRNPQLQASDEGFSVSADFVFDFNPRLEEAVNRGVVLYFVVDFELSRARWYWLDEKVVTRSRTFRLYYHALTRQYRLTTGPLHQNFATLEEALRTFSRMRNWQVLDKGAVRNDESYQAALRMRLDLSQMAKTFQVSALSNRDWSLASDWTRWNFLPSEVRAVDPRGAGFGSGLSGAGLADLRVAGEPR